MQASNIKKLAAISLFLLLSTGAAGYYIASGTKQTGITLETQTSEFEAPARNRSGLMQARDQSTEAEIRKFEELIAHDDPPIFTTPFKVLDHLFGDLREGFIYPDFTQLQQVDPSAAAEIKSLTGIYLMPVVDHDDPNYGKLPPEIHMYFNDGSKKLDPKSFDRREAVLIRINVANEKMDPTEMIESYKKERQEGISKAEIDPKVIDINGIEGYARPPGFNVFSDYDKTPILPVVMWQQGNVMYIITGSHSKDGTQLDTLVAIARSMKPFQLD